VTVETFAAWKAKFDEEMKTHVKTSIKDEATAKLTGTSAIRSSSSSVCL
jgi:hypothetical protein